MHLGAEGSMMSPGRVQSPEGAKTLVISFNTAAGAVATLVKRRFLITCYTEVDTGRLRLDPTLTSGQIAGSRTGAKKILIYNTHMHPMSSFDPSNCGTGTTPRGRNTWVISTLKLMEQFTQRSLCQTLQKEIHWIWTTWRDNLHLHTHQKP